MKILMENISQNRKEWLEKRKGTISSSTISSICGLNKWESVFERWARDTGKIPSPEENDEMWLGTEMQPVIQKLVQRRHGLILKDADCLVQHDNIPWACASPDCWEMDLNKRRVMEVLHERTGEMEKRPDDRDCLSGITEVKNTGLHMKQHWEDSAPLAPVIQLQWQLGVCGLQAGHVAGLIGGSARRLKVYPVTFSEEIWDLCIQRAQEYLELVMKDIPPGAGPGDLKLLGMLVAERTKEVVELQGEEVPQLISTYDEAVARRSELKEMLDHWDTKVEGVKARLAQLLGTAEAGIYDGRIVTAKMVQVKEHMRKASEYLKVTVK